MQLVTCDPDRRNVEVLISSERVDKAHPFDKEQPEVVSFLYHDPLRERLLFFVHHKLWQFDLATRSVTPWVELTRSNTVGHPDCGLEIDCIVVSKRTQELLVNRSMAFWSINLATGLHRRIPEQGYLNQSYPGSIGGWYGGYLWLDSEWQVYSPEVNAYFPLQHPFSDQKPPSYLGSRTCEIDNQGRYAVVRDRHHLWLAELKGREQFFVNPHSTSKQTKK